MTPLEDKIYNLIFSTLPENQELGWLLDESQNRSRLKRKWNRENSALLKRQLMTVERLMTAEKLVFIKNMRYARLPKLPLLKHFSLDYRAAYELDVSKCERLETLSCTDNHILSLKLQNCTQLKKIDCYFNPLKELNLAGCTLLEELNCYATSLAKLDIRNCPNLKSINCVQTNIDELDIRNCPYLEFINVDDATTLIR